MATSTTDQNTANANANVASNNAAQNAANLSPLYDASGNITGYSHTNNGVTTVTGQSGSNAALGAATPVNTTQDASAINDQISGNTSGVIFPQAPSGSTATNANTSIPNPIPSAADIISQGTAQTPAEQTNTTLLQKVAALIGNKTGQTTLTNNAETAAGLPAMNKQLNDLNTQLQGLNDQATQLQLAAGAGGTIENQEQNQAQGRGITAGGLAPLTAADLRNNQVQQAAIAARALTLKSTIYGLQGNIALAKDAADKAAAAQFEQEQQQIDYMNALIAANAPQMTKEEKAQADLVQANLADRQNKIDQAKQDKTTAIGLAVAAMKNNPNNPQAQYNAQQVLALDPTDPNYLQKVTQLVGQYQSDPIATQQALANLAKTRAETAAIVPATSPNDPNAVPTDPNSQSILSQTGLSVAAFNFLTQGTASLSRLSAADRKNIMNEAQNYLNKKGVDISTFQSQYKAYNDVLQKNVERANNTKIFAGEISGTVDQFVNDIGNDFGKLKAANVAALFAGKQVNDPTTQKYAFDLQTMQNDLAGYYAASRGATQPELQDLNAAALVIQSGLNGKSAKAFQDSINANEEKVTGVVNKGVDSARKQVWDLFGVGDRYQSNSSGTVKVKSPDGKTGTIPAAQLQDALKQGYTQL